MKYFVIYYIDFTNFKVKLKNSYATQEEANENLLSTALDFVREEQGKQQADIALQNSKSEKDLLTENFKEGMYIKSSSDNEVITSVTVYNKIKEIVSGTFYNSWEMKLNKIGTFGVSEVELNIPSPLPPILPSGIIQPAIPKRVNTVNNVSCYIDELKNKLKSGNFGLRPASRRDEAVLKAQIETVIIQDGDADDCIDHYDYNNYDN